MFNFEGRDVMNITVSDIGSDKYFKVRIDFPNGSYRELFVSWKALEESWFRKQA